MPPSRRGELLPPRRDNVARPRLPRLTERLIRAQHRPHTLHGVVSIPAGVRATVLVSSSWRLDRTAALVRLLERELAEAGLALALFDDLLPSRASADPLSRFDTAVLASRLIAATDALISDPRLGALPVGCLGLGGAGDAAVIAAAERRAAMSAVVLVDSRLIAASLSLREMKAPALLLLSRPTPEDCAFLVTAERSNRRVRVFDGPARVGGPLPVRSVVRDARVWLARHLSKPGA